MRISRSHGLLQTAIELDWPAADVEHLSVSDTEDAYVVVRPELTARTREHKIPVAHIWMDNSSVPPCPTVDTLNIVSLASPLPWMRIDGSATNLDTRVLMGALLQGSSRRFVSSTTKAHARWSLVASDSTFRDLMITALMLMISETYHITESQSFSTAVPRVGCLLLGMFLPSKT